MISLISLAALLLAFDLAQSVPVLKTKRQGLSLPPLIPAIPGVTEILGDNDIPLPILQIPTPALPSPPFTASDLKPKVIGYFWTGAGDKNHADFLAAFSLDSDTFGTFISLADAPTSGNEPHHLNVSKDKKTLVGTGLLSLLKTQDTSYFFDISNPYRPAFKKSQRALLSSIADEIVAIPGGGFFVTHMGSAAGTSPGRLVEYDANYNLKAEWPAVTDLAGTANILASQFSPHGLSINFDKGIILTSDFVVPLTTLKPTLGIVRANTLRLWNLSARTIINTITIPNGGGIQDVKFIPYNNETAAIATAVHLGQVWIIYPFRFDSNGKQGVAELLYDLGPKAQDVVAIYSDLSANGKFLYLTLTTANHIAALDISDLNNVKRLDDPNEDQPVIGAHSIRVTPDQKHIVVCDYFVQQGDIGILNTPADYRVLYLDIQPDGSFKFGRSIDFNKIFSNRGGGRPHFSTIGDFTDPANPKFNSY